MTPKWQKLASLAQEICTPWFQYFGAVFASKGYRFKNILYKILKFYNFLSVHLEMVIIELICLFIKYMRQY